MMRRSFRDVLVESFVAEMGIENETQHPEQRTILRKLEYIDTMALKGRLPEELSDEVEQAMRKITMALETENPTKISAALELGKQIISKVDIPDWVR